MVSNARSLAALKRFANPKELIALGERTRESWSERRRKRPPRTTGWTIADVSRWKRYRITPEEYKALVTQANGICGICKATTKKLVVDHDHKTSIIRGLLCVPCNSNLGWFERFQESASDYLQTSIKDRQNARDSH